MIKNFFQIAISDNDEKIEAPGYPSVEKYFSDFTYSLFNEQDLIAIAKRYGDHHVAEAIAGIRSYAFKADLGRYYLLYRVGGWYSDITNTFLMRPEISEDIAFLAFHDIPDGTPGPWAFQNSIIYSAQGSPQLESVIDRCVSNYRNKNYGMNPLSVTGPLLFGTCIASCGVNPGKYSFGFFREYKKEKYFMLESGDKLARYKDSSLIPGDSGIPGGNSYLDMWHNRELY
jgi:mannosyltransferase OCH1-like enzyme